MDWTFWRKRYWTACNSNLEAQLKKTVFMCVPDASRSTPLQRACWSGDTCTKTGQTERAGGTNAWLAHQAPDAAPQTGLPGTQLPRRSWSHASASSSRAVPPARSSPRGKAQAPAVLYTHIRIHMPTYTHTYTCSYSNNALWKCWFDIITWVTCLRLNASSTFCQRMVNSQTNLKYSFI